MSIDKCPTQAEAAAEQLARWYRFLLPHNAEQEKILEKISVPIEKSRRHDPGPLPQD
jgi:hypothetical protein